MIETLKEILRSSLEPYLNGSAIRSLINLISESSKRKVYYSEGEETFDLPKGYNVYFYSPTISDEGGLEIELPKSIDYDGAEVIVTNVRSNLGPIGIVSEAEIHPSNISSEVAVGSSIKMIYDGCNSTWLIISIYPSLM